MRLRQLLFRSATARKLNRRLDNHQRAHPPRRPSTWTTGPPDFIGIGAQRCGTTWWYRLIIEHPGVHRRRLKELQFFDRYGGGLLTGLELDDYERFFPRPSGTVIGEWTPGYMFRKGVPALIRRIAPEARLLVLLRDPVERYLSGVTFQSDFPGGVTDANREDAFRRGLYAEQLENCFEHLDRARCLVLQHERCVQDSSGEITRTYAFLGLDASFVPGSINRKINVAPAEKVNVSAAQRAELVGRYNDDVVRLAKLIPDLDLALWPNFRDLAS